MIQGGDLVGVAAQQRHVVGEAVDRVEQHAAPDAPADGGELVVGKVDAKGAAQDLEDGVELAGVVVGQCCGGLGGLGPGDVRVASDPGQLLGDRRGRQHEIDDLGGDRALRHAGVLGRLGVLREGHAARRLDGGQAARAVRRGARQHDADGLLAAFVGEGLQKGVDRQVAAGGFGARRQSQVSGLDDQVGVGRDHVDVVGGDGRFVDHLGDRHVRLAGQQLGQQAGVLGIEVLDEDVGHAGVVGQVLEELGERFEAAGRGADADDGADTRAVPPGRGPARPAGAALGRLVGGHRSPRKTVGECVGVVARIGRQVQAAPVTRILPAS